MNNDIYVLAHEMRNPLCVVKGYLEMLNEDNINKYKKIIARQVNESLDILSDYLEFNRISLKKEEIDLNVLLEDINLNMKDYLKDKNVSLNINYLDDEIYFEGDYNKLKQVFNNIIKNSIESKSKSIIISYRVMFGRITICIKNDGLKIENDAIYQIGNCYTNKENGNGIGTNLIKKIVRLHNGKIKYRNNKKNGVSVYITLNLLRNNI